MTGPEMLLKALGLDPQAMKAALESTITNINSLAASMKEINARLEKIDGRLTSIEECIDVSIGCFKVMDERITLLETENDAANNVRKISNG